MCHSPIWQKQPLTWLAQCRHAMSWFATRWQRLPAWWAQARNEAEIRDSPGSAVSSHLPTPFTTDHTELLTPEQTAICTTPRQRRADRLQWLIPELCGRSRRKWGTFYTLTHTWPTFQHACAHTSLLTWGRLVQAPSKALAHRICNTRKMNWNHRKHTHKRAPPHTHTCTMVWNKCACSSLRRGRKHKYRPYVSSARSSTCTNTQQMVWAHS